MNPLVINDFGVTMRVWDNSLVIENKKLKKQYACLPPRASDYDTIVMGSHHTGSVSFDAIRWLSGHLIPVYFMSWNGHLDSIILPKRPNNMNKVKLAQYSAFTDPVRKLGIAKEFVLEKFRVSEIVLEHMNAHKETFDYVQRFAHSARESRNIRNLMACEAVVAEEYWKQYAQYVHEIAPQLKFEGRRGARQLYNKSTTDPINVCLNYLYGIQSAYVRSILNSHSVDTTLSSLHYSVNNESLVWDFQELSRGWFDLCLLELLEEKKIQKGGFWFNDDYFMRLEYETSELLVQKVAEKLNTKMNYKTSMPHGHENESWTLEGILYWHGHSFTNYLSGKSKELSFGTLESAS